MASSPSCRIRRVNPRMQQTRLGVARRAQFGDYYVCRASFRYFRCAKKSVRSRNFATYCHLPTLVPHRFRLRRQRRQPYIRATGCHAQCEFFRQWSPCRLPQTECC